MSSLIRTAGLFYNAVLIKEMEDFAAFVVCQYKARCRDGNLVAVTFVDVGVSSGGLGLSLGPNNQIARVGG